VTTEKVPPDPEADPVWIEIEMKNSLPFWEEVWTIGLHEEY
jgi:hypothetical protein